jgi:glycosyltransferase involved in cell wall biosynthesis
MQIDLSILICSVTTRIESGLTPLIKWLQEQATENVEILVSLDNKKRSVGEKRNNLISECRGRYVCFIDDDDMVSSDYVASILEAIKQDTDVITFDANRYVDNKFDKRVKYGIQYRKDSEDANFYYRIPNHLMCFKRSLAIDTSYQYISYGEDAQWAKDVFYKIKTQHNIDKVLYSYYFSPTKTETQK